MPRNAGSSPLKCQVCLGNEQRRAGTAEMFADGGRECLPLADASRLPSGRGGSGSGGAEAPRRVNAALRLATGTFADRYTRPSVSDGWRGCMYVCQLSEASRLPDGVRAGHSGGAKAPRRVNAAQRGVSIRNGEKRTPLRSPVDLLTLCAWCGRFHVDIRPSEVRPYKERRGRLPDNDVPWTLHWWEKKLEDKRELKAL